MLGLLVNRQAKSINTDGGRFLKGVLPDADDFPSPAPKMAGYAAVAGHVGLAFAVPEGSVGFRSGVALGAAVQKAAINEYSQLRPRKRNIGFPLDSKLATPTRNSQCTQKSR